MSERVSPCPERFPQGTGNRPRCPLGSLSCTLGLGAGKVRWRVHPAGTAHHPGPPEQVCECHHVEKTHDMCPTLGSMTGPRTRRPSKGETYSKDYKPDNVTNSNSRGQYLLFSSIILMLFCFINLPPAQKKSRPERRGMMRTERAPFGASCCGASVLEHPHIPPPPSRRPRKGVQPSPRSPWSLSLIHI